MSYIDEIEDPYSNPEITRESISAVGASTGSEEPEEVVFEFERYDKAFPRKEFDFIRTDHSKVSVDLYTELVKSNHVFLSKKKNDTIISVAEEFLLSNVSEDKDRIVNRIRFLDGDTKKVVMVKTFKQYYEKYMVTFIANGVIVACGEHGGDISDFGFEYNKKGFIVMHPSHKHTFVNGPLKTAWTHVVKKCKMTECGEKHPRDFPEVLEDRMAKRTKLLQEEQDLLHSKDFFSQLLEKAEKEPQHFHFLDTVFMQPAKVKSTFKKLSDDATEKYEKKNKERVAIQNVLDGK